MVQKNKLHIQSGETGPWRSCNLDAEQLTCNSFIHFVFLICLLLYYFWHLVMNILGFLQCHCKVCLWYSSPCTMCVHLCVKICWKVICDLLITHFSYISNYQTMLFLFAKRDATGPICYLWGQCRYLSY